MSGGVALAVGLASAAAGAYSARQQAKAANKSRNSTTDQTTTQTPWMSDTITPDINSVIDYQRGLVQRGAPQVDRRGNVTYAALPIGASPQAPPPKPPPGPLVGGGAGGAGGRPGAKSRGGAGGGSSTWTNARGELMTVGANGKPVRAGSGPAGATAAGSARPAGPDLSTPQGIFGEVARRGLDAGNTGTIGQARNVMGNIWGASGGDGSVAGGEQTGFEGYNPILDRLAGTLEGDVEGRVGRDLLLGFLGENGRSGAGGSGGGRTGGSGAGGGNSGSASVRMANPGYWESWGGPGAGGGSGNYGSGVPDTMVPESFFGTQTRAMFDEQANDAELQALIDAMNEDVERGMFEDMAQLDAAAAGAGRFGGDTWKGMSRDAREEALQEMLKNSAGVRVGDREARRAARLASLGLVNQRDLGLLGANVQREGIAAGERASRAAAGASAASLAEQSALTRRAQDLSAIGALLDTEQFSLGQLGDVGGQLSGDRLSALGMVPGLEGIGLSGLQTALGAGGGLVDMRGQDIQRGIAGQQAAIARQGMNQQLGMYNASQQQAMVNDYLRTMMGIGGMGGTSHTTGTNVQPGLGVSPTGAAAMGALGGAATGLAAYQSYRGY